MTKRYMLLAALFCAAFIQAEEKDLGKRSGGLSGKDKATFYYAKDLSAADVIAGTTLSASGYYLLSGSAAVTSATPINITGSNIVLDFDGNAISWSSTGIKAIAIASGAKNITIKNGHISGAFLGDAITIGTNAANILIENVHIDGMNDDGTDASGISAIGTSGNEIVNLTLRNVSVSNVTPTSAAAYPIDCDYVHGLHLENVSINSAVTTTSGVVVGLRVQNSNSITGGNIDSTNHVGIAGTTGIQMVACEDVNLHNVRASQLSDSTAVSTSGIIMTTCNNVNIDGLSVNNLTKTLNSILFTTVKNSTISDFTVTNATSTTTLTSIKLVASSSILLRNGSISNNTATAGLYIGVATATTANTNITLENVDILANTATTDGAMTGINAALVNGLIINNCKVSHNSATDTDDTRIVKGLNAVSTATDLIITNSQFNANSTSTGTTTATGGLSAGVYVDGVSHCQIMNTTANRNNGAGRTYGFYISGSDNLVMDNCTAKGNAAATVAGADALNQDGGGADTDGIQEELPSAGLYLLGSDHALVTNCQFINNKSGNYADGSGSTIIDVATTSCAAGIANVGTSTSVLNIGNTFINCICQGNATQLYNAAPANFTTAYGANGNHWVSEAFAAGAVEDHTIATTYKDCQFNANGLACNYAFGFGLCVASGCKTLSVHNCTAANNNFYGFFDDTATTSKMVFTGCISSMNGVDNSVAVTEVANADTRNYYINKATSPYKSVTMEDRSQIAPTGSALINLSITPI